MPIQVGKTKSHYDLHLPGDDTGDNISSENPYFCELTALYWAWKNLKNVDVIGLCHYRRYFDFNNKSLPFIDTRQKKQSAFEKINVDIPSKLLKKIISQKSIVVAKESISHLSNYETYCTFHNSMDLRRLEEFIRSNSERKYYDSFVHAMYHSNKFSPYNMFLMTWDDFNSYCSWLFPLLFEFSKITHIEFYDSYQKRIYGYLAERLLNVWLMANNKSCIKKTVYQVLPNNTKCNNIVKTMYNRLIANISYSVNLLAYDSLKHIFVK